MKKTKQSFKWNEVTPLSKYLAMSLFVALPFVGFISGMKYQRLNAVCQVNDSPSDLIRRQSALNDTYNWRDYENKELGFSMKYPRDMEAPSVVDYGQGVSLYREDKNVPQNNVSIYVGQNDLQNKTLKEVATLTNDPRLGTVLSPTKEINFSGLRGYTYRVSQTGRDVTYIFLPSKNAKKYFAITAENYESNQSQQILTTFKQLD